MTTFYGGSPSEPSLEPPYGTDLYDDAELEVVKKLLTRHGESFDLMCEERWRDYDIGTRVIDSAEFWNAMGEAHAWEGVKRPTPEDRLNTLKAKAAVYDAMKRVARKQLWDCAALELEAEEYLEAERNGFP